jgi:hypothetical protein
MAKNYNEHKKACSCKQKREILKKKRQKKYNKRSTREYFDQQICSDPKEEETRLRIIEYRDKKFL